jgi:recombinational DNA repair ATPase RecF
LRGQVRTAILALSSAEATWMQNRTGHLPVLLFDEALAELDPQRRVDSSPTWLKVTNR